VVTPATLMLFAQISAWRMRRKQARAVKRRRKTLRAAAPSSVKLPPELMPEAAE
jgi:hypothetical protein